MSNQVPPSVTRRSFAALAFSMATALSLALPLNAQAQEVTSDVASGPELIMVEQAGCEWCKRWNEEIGPIYPKTREGAFAPLRRVDLHAIPQDLQVQRRVSFTPTFLIVKDGLEMARLEGYPGEDFFWPLIAKLMSKHLEFPLDGAESPES
ncbi:hypothetical protein [Phaeobacter sp. 11ANDIMAR09]|uniref:hypothetical protein n=1 Tax=Phaeobacter sp. 11ANDIMAR09 TaxID=1225647 RepID=UPI000AB15C13|nr:hypothetical protein [Phaeobacter sp. 11ANDIMAR09]